MWNIELYKLVLGLIVMEIIKELLIACIVNLDFEVFNPVRNHNVWRKINWFGVVIGTIVLHIFYPILSIFYWGYILVTVGRK